MMYKFQLKKIYTYDWFCGPGSHIKTENSYFKIVIIFHSITVFTLFFTLKKSYRPQTFEQ